MDSVWRGMYLTTVRPTVAPRDEPRAGTVRRRLLTISTPRDKPWHDALCAKYGPEITAFAGRKLPPQYRHAAEDVAQRVLNAAWDRRDKVHDEPRGWLYSATVKIAASVKRAEDKHHRGRDYSDTALTAATLSHEDAFMQAAAWNALTSMLDPVDRDILELTVVMGFTHAEVVEALQPPYRRYRLTVGNVAQRKLRALDRIRDHVGDDPQRFIHRGDDA